jgi:pyruvate dehydrogenase E2 component (dihydrolipoamide acetyltransferase)
MRIEIIIPDIAENVETGIIANILVSEGDTVKKEDPLVEVETDKATTEIPSTADGKVAEIKVEAGDDVSVGDVIMVLEGQQGDQEAKEAEQRPSQEKGKEQEAHEDEESPGKDPVSEEEGPEEVASEEDFSTEENDRAEKSDAADVPASPSVRRKAREGGVDLRKVSGSGPGNRITTEDVKKFTEKVREERTALPDFSKWGHISRKPMDNIRKLTAQRMQGSWRQIPHVTQFDEADVSGLDQFMKDQKDTFEKKGAKLTFTAVLLKVSAFALQRFPRFNSSLDPEKDEIIYKDFINIGIAVDTEQGLLVPVIKNVERKSLTELAIELAEVAGKARDKKISPDELQGGNFSVSNLGGIGGTAFTPIVYAPQVAVLGISRMQQKPVYQNGDLANRMVLPLSLSYDHRVIDGAEGARFLRWICDVLKDPYALLQ